MPFRITIYTLVDLLSKGTFLSTFSSIRIELFIPRERFNVLILTPENEFSEIIYV